MQWLFIIPCSILAFVLSPRTHAAPFVPADNTFQFRSRSWQVESDLPQNAVQAIAQTADGFLWLGTQSGLYSFDGYQFTRHNHPRLKNDRINALAVAADGSLWAGTATDGVCRIRNGEVRHYSLNGLADPRVLSLAADPDGSVWIGTVLGVAYFDGNEIRPFGTEAIPARGTIRAIARMPNNTHWFASAGVLIAASNAVPFLRLGQGIGVPSGYLRALQVDNREALWIGSNSGLSRWKNGKFTHFTKAHGLPDNTVTAVFEDSRQRLWIGTYSGLCRKVGERFMPVLSEDGEPFDQIFSIAEDHENNLWVGAKNGLIRLHEDRFRTYLTRDGLTHNNVISVLGEQPGLWVGTWGGGLHYFANGTVETWSRDRFAELRNDLILALHKTRDGSLWFGTDYDGGLYQWKDGALKAFRDEGVMRSPVRDIHEDYEGNLWVATSFGLVRRRDGVFQKFLVAGGLPTSVIRCLAEDAANVLWVGTEKGLARRNAESFETLTNLTGLPDIKILSLYADAATNLWVGTAGGLALVRNGAFLSYGKRQRLLTNAIVEILEDDLGFFWLATERGILRIQKDDLLTDETKREIACELFGTADGMVSSVCVGTAKPSAWKMRDGRLWFATTRGLVTTDSRRVMKKNTRPPPVFITSFLADKKRIQETGDKRQESESGKMRKWESENVHFPTFSPAHLLIPPGRGELEINYTALSFRSPEQNQFKYQLVGFDSEWVNAGARRTAFYNNLPPGEYRFQVIASNNDGIWNTLGANVKFTLQPHLWQTKWFQAFAILSLGLFTALAARHVTKRRMQIRLNRLEQEHALEKERTRIAQDMHDDLGARITEILLVGKQTLQKGSDAKSIERNVVRMCDAAQEIATDLNAIVFAVNPKNDTLEHLVAYIYKYVEKYLAASTVRCRLDVPIDVPDMPVSSEVRHHIVMSIKEALNNALKHAQASELSVAVTFENGMLSVAVSDDGKGFSQSSAGGSGNGLESMAKRMKEIGGRFELKSDPGKGTRVELQVPIRSDGVGE